MFFVQNMLNQKGRGTDSLGIKASAKYCREDIENKIRWRRLNHFVFSPDFW